MVVSRDATVVDSSQTGKVLVTSITLAVLGTIFVVSRLITRFKSKTHGWDDYFMCLAEVGAPHRCAASL